MSNNFNSQKILFINITFMKFYSGHIGDYCLGGGSFVQKNNYGHEIFNFQDVDGYYFGYASPSGKVNLKEISNDIKHDELGSYLDNVLVIFTSNHNGRKICGYYKDAKVYANPIESNDAKRFIAIANTFAPYNIICSKKNGFLIPVEKRIFNVKGFGRHPLWYANKPKDEEEKIKISDYIQGLIDENELFYETDERKYYEGERIKATVEQRKRDNKAREECIRIHGYSCQICGMNFEKVYGDIGKNFIEVHHKNELSLLSEEITETNPQDDLIPVCSNCHSMIHKRRPCYTVDEIKTIYQQLNTNNSEGGKCNEKRT